MQVKPNQTIKIFYSYAHEDKSLRDELEKHLRPLKRQGQITEWHDQAIQAGTHRAEEIDTHLSTSDIILLLISPDFLASEYCWSVEMQRALQRHRDGKARIIPIILRPIDWRSTPIGELEALPRGGKPLTRWSDRDEALEDVAKEIRDVVTILLAQRDPQTIYMRATSTSPTFLFYEECHHIFMQGHTWCQADLLQPTDFSNFALQVEMTILEGSGGGVAFRAGQGEPTGYRFFVGREFFDCCYGNIVLTRSPTLKTDLNCACLLTVIALNENIFLYVNKKYIATIVDRSARSGCIGTMITNLVEQDQTHVMFRNLQVWDMTDNS